MKSRLKIAVRTALMLSIGALAACAHLQDDDIQAARLTTPEQVQTRLDTGLPQGAWPGPTWWQRYGDADLDQLIETALRDAPSMRAVAARTEQAGEGVERVRALTGLKTLGVAQINRQWSRTTGDVDGISLNTQIPGIPALSTPVSSTSAVAGLAGIYNFDLWGGKKAAIDAAIGAQHAQQAEAVAARLALANAIAQSWFRLRTQTRKIELLQEILEIQREGIDASAARKQRGLVTDVANVPSRQQKLLTEQLLVTLRAEVAAETAALRALAGLPSDAELPTPQAGLPATSPSLPAELPYALLARRPDLVAQRWAVQASYDQVEVAKAAFYPQFDLLGFIGMGHIDLKGLHLTRQQFNLIPGVTLPIFNLDALRSGLRSARTASNVLVEQYNQAVLNAVRDVVAAASVLQASEQQLMLEEDKIRQADIPANDARARAERGLVSRVQARLASLPVLQEKLLQTDAQGAALAADIALVTALGGGYEADTQTGSPEATAHARQTTAD